MIQAIYRQITKIAVAVVAAFFFLFHIHDRGGDQIAGNEIDGVVIDTSNVQAPPTPVPTPIEADKKPEAKILACKYCKKLFVKSSDGHSAIVCGLYHSDNQTHRAANTMSHNSANTKKAAESPVDMQPTPSGALRKRTRLARWCRRLLSRLTGRHQRRDSKNADGDASTTSKKASDVNTLGGVASKPIPDANHASGNKKMTPKLPEISSTPKFYYQPVYFPTTGPYVNAYPPINPKLLDIDDMDSEMTTEDNVGEVKQSGSAGSSHAATSRGNDESTKKSTAEPNLTHSQ
ncbi:hypothetical protein QBC37DRAFT_372293 [Rhypophila decipiens]|uniref:Uncharacterized protein n=1 Tax=Rhypophila decipiens TaxID=261697 RepID=A0AAN6YC50_9PEZI|nr:hypothetical protein QBC37DRAFT_372293 [Rhypophila decipiens]